MEISNFERKLRINFALLNIKQTLIIVTEAIYSRFESKFMDAVLVGEGVEMNGSSPYLGNKDLWLK